MRGALKRLLAGTVDWTLLGSYVFCLCYFAFMEFDSEQQPFLAVFAVGAPVLYFTLLESGFGGSSTLGKRLLGLRVLDGALGPLPIYRSALRAITKIAIPTIIVMGAMRWSSGHPMLLFALILMAYLLIPVSICVGKGVFGLDDVPLGTGVFGAGDASFMLHKGGLYYLRTILIAGALAFPTSALLNDRMWGNVSDPLMKLAHKGMETYRPLVVPILKEMTDADLIRFVKLVQVQPGLIPLSSNFDVSPTRNLNKSMAGFRDRIPLMSVQVELTRRGYESELVRLRILELLLQLLPGFMPAVTAQGVFVSVNLRTKEVFGLMEFSRGTTHLLVYRRSSIEPSKVEMAIIEPDDFRSRYWGFAITTP